MPLRPLPAAWRSHAGRNLPRYTSYPTAVAFEPAVGEAEARTWLAATRAHQPISAYVHVPFCKRLCWYCGCATSVFHEYDRVRAFFQTLMLEVDLWADAIGPHAGAAHLHFGGGSPNALSPEDFKALVGRMAERFALRPGAEVAAELDPGMLTEAFIDAAGEAGVTRASLGVQTFDPDVQARVNRIQPFDMVAAANERLRKVGVSAINFDLMYGLPGQTPENVAASTEAAITLRPDRVAVFGYAHVPWMKKHQVMIKEADLADGDGRWAQAEAADETLRAAGYVRIGLDHYALPEDPLTVAAAAGRLRRNFQGYTDDPAPVLVPIGPSSIGRFAEGFVQNATATDAWAREVEAGRLPVARRLPVSAEDELRASVIERLMCDLTVDVAAVCRAHGFADATLDSSIVAAGRLQRDGLCVVSGRVIRIPAEAHRVMRVVAACFDARLPLAASRHARAV
ncbi:oxygen-independent coproporphyrinogen III oxidase [Brevundimonas sp.]|uniref:oxygen-independent coproporphyrinogen III oxidase n=1 Tax=Brevundimonas sp. TaxID=1871086 RepID=UPI002D332B0A|nr:oxygen-independent coproporphyrinogen III oxidase [Brevundimonas sp.]HYD27062.1 oxygen-independent coproporphyrinogen III oxidase [Brevundimonas sp.]